LIGGKSTSPDGDRWPTQPLPEAPRATARPALPPLRRSAPPAPVWRPAGPPDQPGEAAGRGRRPRRRRRRGLRRLAVVALLLQLVLAVFLGALTWWTPGTTAFMLEDGAPVTYQYVSLDHVSRYLIAAVIAHEDEQLGTRSGAFTFADFMARVSAYAQGKPDPSGSTIPQQLAKNVFLWPHQDPLRKAAEAILSTEMNAALSHQRTLELYVNYAQFGPHLYGVCAASWYYFGTAPWEMTQYQADQLMGVLPDPDLVSRAPGGGIDIGRAANPLAVNLINGAANVHVPRELAGMGGWRAAIATIGLHDTATAHASQRANPNACSTMPASVAQLMHHQ
jgi:monofunctional biosynthetic peptidoglycan transglycosylase